MLTNTTNPSSKVRIPFGAYKGQTLDQVPREYLQWIVDTNDGRRYLWLAKQIREFLDAAEDSPDEIGPHDYDGFLAELRARGNWFVLPRVFFRAFTCDEADVLGHLLNRAAHQADADGWLPCTSTSLEDDLDLDLDDQKRILRSLEELGVIEQAKRGNPPRRHVRINVRRIEELLGETCS